MELFSIRIRRTFQLVSTPLDTDLLSNRKIRQIKHKYGSDAFLLYIALLCDIYANGYYITAYDLVELSPYFTLPEVSLCFELGVKGEYGEFMGDQYAHPHPLAERLYPARVYQSLQERGLIHDTPEEKRHAMSLFAHWRPPGPLPVSEDYRLTMVRQQAMAWLLRRYFDGLIAKEKA